jgi:SET domain-containing protein
MGSQFNHSCAPNTAFCHDAFGMLRLITYFFFVKLRFLGNIRIVVLRDVSVGEELTVDYAFGIFLLYAFIYLFFFF